MYDFSSASDKIKKSINELNSKYSQINSELNSIKSRIPSDAGKTAERLKEIKDNCLKLSLQVEEIYRDFYSNSKEFQTFYNEIKSGFDDFSQEVNEINSIKEKIIQFHDGLSTREENLNELLEGIKSSLDESNGYLESSKNFPIRIKEIEGLLDKIENDNSTIEKIKSSVLKRKSEIDEIYREILGYEEETEDGISQHVDGLRDELKNSINNISNKVLNLEDIFNSELKAYKDNYKEILTANNEEFNKIKNDASSYITETKNIITGLLPNAMAAGLSHAYAEKREKESTDLKILERNFFIAIVCLIFVSTIPVCVAIYMLSETDKDLFQVIDFLPKLMSGFIPLYAPIFWVAYSTNKKIKLSKRIIEEYTHKEVLGKTFSGLSNQIEKLNAEEGIQNELRMKLLYNFMQVTAENPGKLISDYNTADHPVMDALEKSAKLSDVIDKITRIPGFSPLAKKLAEKADDLMEKNNKKIQDGFDAHEALNSKAENKDSQ